MCGLAEHNSTQQKTFAHAALLAQLDHRGPDDREHWGEQRIDFWYFPLR